MIMYQDYEIGNIYDETQKFFEKKESRVNFEINQISYNVKSNSIHTSFGENVSSKSIEEFLLRESWSPFDIMYSNHYNIPPDRKNLSHPIPDYLVYIQFQRADETPWIIKALDDSQDSKFEKIYQSDQTKTMVFRINNP